MRFVYLSIVFVLICSCSKQNQEAFAKQTDTIDKLAALPEKVIFPDDNPYSEEKAKLGKLLFFDPILSGNKDVACATCHHPEFGFADGLDLSIGVNGEGFGSKRSFRPGNTIPIVKRNSPTVINTAFNGIENTKTYNPHTAPMFWDNRSLSLEKQALEPIKSLEEMRGHEISKEAILDTVVRRINKIQGYNQMFKLVFPEENEIWASLIAKAIATYERTITASNSRFDQYMRGDKKALSSIELDGLNAFLRTGCAKCHNGPMLSDYKLHVLGMAENEKLKEADRGAHNAFAFRTPTLRNLSQTFPYMHNGKAKTLTNVLEFYEDLSGKKLHNSLLKEEQLDPLLKDLKVEFKDIELIVEFLQTLNDNNYDKSVPEKVPSGLPVGGRIR